MGEPRDWRVRIEVLEKFNELQALVNRTLTVALADVTRRLSALEHSGRAKEVAGREEAPRYTCPNCWDPHGCIENEWCGFVGRHVNALRSPDSPLPEPEKQDATAWRTLCVECGPNVFIDVDGCCTTCGATATGTWLAALRSPDSEQGHTRIEGKAQREFQVSGLWRWRFYEAGEVAWERYPSVPAVLLLPSPSSTEEPK